MRQAFNSHEVRRTLELDGKAYDYFSLVAAQQAGLGQPTL